MIDLYNEAQKIRYEFTFCFYKVSITKRTAAARIKTLQLEDLKDILEISFNSNTLPFDLPNDRMVVTIVTK